MILILHLPPQDSRRLVELVMVHEQQFDSSASLGGVHHKAKNSYQGFKYLAMAILLKSNIVLTPYYKI